MKFIYEHIINTIIMSMREHEPRQQRRDSSRLANDHTNTGGVGTPVNNTPYSRTNTNVNPEHIQENEDEDIEMQPLKGRGLITEKEKSTAKNKGSDHNFFKILIVAYISSWAGFYLLVHHNKEAKDLSSAPSIIISVEFVKLAFASVLFCKSNGAGELMHFFRNHEQFLKEMKCYFPIAALYAICNNLMMFNLKNNNPIVYQILVCSRLLMVSVVWQILFQVQIPKKRKVALGLITIGVMIKCFKQENGDAGVKDIHMDMEKSWWEAIFGYSLVLLQMACSVMASVYNEKMLKQVKCDQYLQNICLYLNSIVINAAVFIFLVPTDNNGGGQEASLLSKTSVMIVITLAAGGLMTAMMLRAAGSVTKCVVTTSITIVTCVIDVAFFNYKLVTPEAVAVTLVTLGSAIYSLN